MTSKHNTNSLTSKVSAKIMCLLARSLKLMINGQGIGKAKFECSNFRIYLELEEIGKEEEKCCELGELKGSPCCNVSPILNALPECNQAKLNLFRSHSQYGLPSYPK